MSEGEIKVCKFINLFWRQSRRTKNQRNKPWLFKQANHIFIKLMVINELVELCIKATLRNRTHVAEYLYFNSAGLTNINVVNLVRFSFCIN